MSKGLHPVKRKINKGVSYCVLLLSFQHIEYRKHHEGFSLIELIVVITVIGILTTVVVPVFGNIQEDAKRAAVDASASSGATSAQSAISKEKNPEDAVLKSNNSDDISVSLESEVFASIDSVCVQASWDNYSSQAGPGCDAEDYSPIDPIPVDEDTINPVIPEDSENGIMRTRWDVAESRDMGLSVRLPLSSDFNGSVDWGDGTYTNSSELTGSQQPVKEYDSPDRYNITIEGTFNHWSPGNDELELVEGLTHVMEWGSTETTTATNGFRDGDLEYIREIPGSLESMRHMLSDLSDFNYDIGHWDTSNINDMHHLFDGASSFNQDISSWDVSNVTNMKGVFRNTDSFNQPLNKWDMGNVESTQSMFTRANAFNQDLNEWDTSSLVNMQSMFYENTAFNGGIGEWDTSNVETMYGIFIRAPKFNQPVGDWNTSNVTNMHWMFHNAESFNQPVGDWDVSNVENFAQMFNRAHVFDQDISNWDTSSGIDMQSMFYDAYDFNQDIGGWDTANVRNMRSMFYDATSFNQDLKGWNVDKVENIDIFSGGSSSLQWSYRPNF